MKFPMPIWVLSLSILALYLHISVCKYHQIINILCPHAGASPECPFTTTPCAYEPQDLSYSYTPSMQTCAIRDSMWLHTVYQLSER